jgi:cell cycle sensor histidine kinase DivJ
MRVAKYWGNWRAGVESVSTMCRRWVNPDVASEEETRLQARLIGLLFSVPLLSALHLAANLPANLGANLVVPILALAFAMPVIAAATLSISGSLRTRNLIMALTAPIAFLSITGGRIGLAPVFYLVLAVAACEAWRLKQARSAWTASSVLLALTAAIMSFASPFGTAVEASFAGLAPVVLAGIGYALSTQSKSQAVESVPPFMSFELAEELVAPVGALAIQVSRNGFVSAVGKNAGNLLALSEGDLAGKGLAERVHLTDKVAFLSWLDALPQQPQSQSINFRMKSGNVDANGAPEWVQITAFAKVVAEIIVLTAICADAATAVASQDQSLPLDCSVMAVVGHELRTPLNAIVGFSDMLKQEMFGPLHNERQREYIDLVHQSGLHLLGVVNSMLDWSRIENGSMQLEGAPFLPAEAAAFAVGIVSNAAMKKKIGLDFQPNSAFDEFAGDHRACQQIMINLLSNAVKFTPDNGMVRLTVDVDDNRLMIVVEDTGIGMTRDQQGRAGTPFYQVDGSHARAQEGTGLGLALVKQMAKLHGGSIEIDSEPGRGTKVTVALASIHAKGTNVAPMQKAPDDESVRIIRVFEERENGTQRKTA